MKDDFGVYHLDIAWGQTREEPQVSLQREILMNWLYFIILIITEIRGNERLGRSCSPSPACTEQVSSVYFVGSDDTASWK